MISGYVIEMENPVTKGQNATFFVLCSSNQNSNLRTPKI